MSGQKWHTEERGIRYYEHDSRMHGKRKDRYYTLRFTVDGKQNEEALGWTSEGWTLTKARLELAKLKEAKRLGQGVTTLRESRTEARKKREQAAQTEALEQAARITLDEFWEHVYSPTQAHKKPLTVKKERDLYLRWIKPRFGFMPMVLIKAEHIEGLKQAMIDDGKAPRTIQYTLAVFSQIWHLASMREIVTGTPPMRGVKLPKFDNRRVRFLTQNEAQNLLKELKEVSDDLYTTALLALACGLRIGEIHALTWADVNFAHDTIFISDPKSGKNRHAYITAEVRTVLESRRTTQLPSELVLPSKNGRQRGQVSKAFNLAVERLTLNSGITDPRHRVVFHTLRHTFASWLVQQGVPLYTVATLMGHSSLEMTQRYAHLAPDTTRSAAMSLSGLLSPSQDTVTPKE